MFGSYRLLLASLVALSHYGLIVYGFNPGQWAVLSFYVLSGFLMERLFCKIPCDGAALVFYADRFLRIYPLYLVIALGTLAIDSSGRRWILENLLLLPLNFAEFTGTRSSIAPAWSLACELQFYLLVPFLSLLGNRSLRFLCLLSVVVFCMSPWLPHATFWAYLGLPGILFAFLSGMLFARGDVIFLKSLWLLFAFLCLLFLASKTLFEGVHTGINVNVCIGYLVALPVAMILSRYSPRASWDQRLGLLSYPLFLIHEPLRKLISLIFPGHGFGMLWYLVFSGSSLN